jgi:hypothetical protein
MAIVATDKAKYDAAWCGVARGHNDALILLNNSVSDATVMRLSWLAKAGDPKPANPPGSVQPNFSAQSQDDDDDQLLQPRAQDFYECGDDETCIGSSGSNGPRSNLSRAIALELRDAAAKGGNINRPRHLIGDLPVLLAQAETINAHFQGYVHAWANGLAASPHTCAVKRWKRAIEKLFRSYQGDGTKLIDLVRSSVGFNSIAELAV